MKKGLILLGCFIALWAGAAVIQWYSDQPVTTSPADADILALERPVPHGYKSFTLLTLKGYIGTNGTFVANYITANYITNVNVLITTNQYVTYATNVNQYVTTQYVNYSFITNLYVTFATNQYLYTTNLYATTIYNNEVYTTNVTAQYITNNYLYSTNVYITYLTNLYLYTTNVTAQFITNLNLYSTNIYVTYLNVASNVYVTNQIIAKTAYITNLIVEAFINTNYGTFPSASNTLAIGSGTNRWLLTLSGDGALTNLSGVGAATMEITASGGARTFYITNATYVPIGDLTSNLAPAGAFAIPSGKIGMLDVDNIGGTVKYSCALQRP